MMTTALDSGHRIGETDPLLNPPENRGVAFSLEDRKRLGLVGRPPSAVLSLGQQAERAYAQLHQLPDDLAPNVYLEQLHDRSEVVYYRLLADHLAELLPIVSTQPSVRHLRASSAVVAVIRAAVADGVADAISVRSTMTANRFDSCKTPCGSRSTRPQVDRRLWGGVAGLVFDEFWPRRTS